MAVYVGTQKYKLNSGIPTISNEWSEINNKPFSTIGEGLEVVSDALTLGINDEIILEALSLTSSISPKSDENNAVLTDEDGVIISF